MTRVTALVVLVLVGASPFSAARGEDKDNQPAGTGRLAAGEYVEVDEKGVPNALLKLRVSEVTPNILEVRGAHGWVAYTSYDEGRKEYRGFFEWQRFGPQRSPAGKWADLYQVRLVRQADGKLYMSGKSKENDFVIRAADKP